MISMKLGKLTLTTKSYCAEEGANACSVDICPESNVSEYEGKDVPQNNTTYHDEVNDAKVKAVPRCIELCCGHDKAGLCANASMIVGVGVSMAVMCNHHRQHHTRRL